jgi:hypothetical protein
MGSHFPVKWNECPVGALNLQDQPSQGVNIMAAYAEVKPKTVTGVESELDRGTPRPEIRITQSNKGSGSTIAYIVAAIVLLAGAYLLYTNNMSTTTVVPSVTQNNTTLPTPDVVIPTTPEPATPPAAEKTNPPAAAPATPPATTY